MRITASGASGLADRAAASGRRAHRLDDPVRIASITKLVVALGVMRLVEQGKLDLDRDVSDLSRLAAAQPGFPDRPITLRLLLSHRSSLRDGVDYAIPLGTTARRRSPRRPKPSTSSIRRAPSSAIPTSISRCRLGDGAATGERFDRLMDGWC
jgi:CubicO group peptidase (beta-lactamase class C family)